MNQMAIHEYLINTDLYLTFSNDGDKLLLVKSLMNILKFTYFNIDMLVWGSCVQKLYKSISFWLKNWLKKGINEVRVWV